MLKLAVSSARPRTDVTDRINSWWFVPQASADCSAGSRQISFQKNQFKATSLEERNDTEAEQTEDMDPRKRSTACLTSDVRTGPNPEARETFSKVVQPHVVRYITAGAPSPTT
jgi:hypothetical protein